MQKMQIGLVLRTLSCLVLLAALGTTAKAQVPDPVHRLELVADETSIDGPDAHPWHLKLAVTLTPGTPGAGAGIIEQWWNSLDEYRITYSMPTYKATFVRHGKITFRTPGTEPPPFLPQYILGQTTHPMPRNSDISGSLPEIVASHFGKLALDCIALRKPANALSDLRTITSKFCLVPGSTQLALRTEDHEVEARVRTGTFRKKELPMELQISVNRALAVTSRIEQLQGQSEPYAEVAQTDGLTPQPTSPDSDTPGLVLGTLVRKTSVSYPQISRNAHIFGEVVLNVVIGADGHVQSLTPIYAADTMLLAAARDAVESWVYSPSMLGGSPTPIQTIVRINFNMEQ